MQIFCNTHSTPQKGIKKSTGFADIQPCVRPGGSVRSSEPAPTMWSGRAFAKSLFCCTHGLKANLSAMAPILNGTFFLNAETEKLSLKKNCMVYC